MATITTPDAVPGEIIEAAWGDAVRADLNALNTELAAKPRGVLARGNGPLTNAPGFAQTPLDISGMAVTWTAVAGRLYRVLARVTVLQASGSGYVSIVITNAANAIHGLTTLTMALNDQQTVTTWVLIGGTGPQTAKVRLSTGAGSATYIGVNESYGLITVEDIGVSA